MTKEEEAHYDGRAKQVKEISTMLGTYQPL